MSVEAKSSPINPAALSSVNTFSITLFMFARQCSVTASGACLQSNSLSPLFLCFLSLLHDRRQGWRMSATSSCAGMYRLLSPASSGTWKTVTFRLNHKYPSKSESRLTSRNNIGLQLMHFNFQILFGKKYLFAALCVYCIRIEGLNEIK